MAYSCIAIHNSDREKSSFTDKFFIDKGTPYISSSVDVIAADHPVNSISTAIASTLSFFCSIISVMRYSNLGVAIRMRMRPAPFLPRLGVVYISMKIGAKVKTTKISSDASGGIIAKVCTYENSPLYGSYQRLLGNWPYSTSSDHYFLSS